MNNNIFPHNTIFSNNEFNINETLILDIVDVFSQIYIEDISVQRTGKTKIVPIVAVNNYEVWNKSKKLLISLINFVTSYVDDWDIKFIHHKVAKKTPLGRLFYLNNVISPKKNILFSGGLDSFSGICQDFNFKENNLFLTGFKINNIEFNRQNSIFNDVFKLRDYTTNCRIFKLNDIKKHEFTQRTRSLLFFSLGVACSKYFGLKSLSLYENGIMSLNPEINQSRYTTKTTHPITLYKFNLLLEKLGIDVKIKHPFLFHTKGEMVSMLPSEYHDFIKQTITCGRSRQDIRYDASKSQCGSCVPCILRKISNSHAELEKYDTDYDVPYGHNLLEPHRLIDEYKSSIKYFLDFKKSIDNHSIFDILRMDNRFYTDHDYLPKTVALLRQFSSEIQHFIKKLKFRV